MLKEEILNALRQLRGSKDLVVIQKKPCVMCNQYLPFDEFHNSKSTYDGKQAYCKKCKKEYMVNKYKEKKQNAIKKAAESENYVTTIEELRAQNALLKKIILRLV